MNKIKNMDEETKKKLVIVLAIISIILIIFVFYLRSRTVNYSSVKEDKSKDVVYTYKTSKDDVFIKEIPYLNLNFDFAKNINKDITSFIGEYETDEYTSIGYNYNINGEVLSFVVKMINYGDETGPKISFKGYNINLKTKKIVTDNELLDLFGYTSKDVEVSIAKKFNEYYKELVKENYYDSDECDYDCFLTYRDVENYLDDIVLYVNNGDLYAYKPFSFYSVLGEEEYFREKHFIFLIEK